MDPSKPSSVCTSIRLHTCNVCVDGVWVFRGRVGVRRVSEMSVGEVGSTGVGREWWGGKGGVDPWVCFWSRTPGLVGGVRSEKDGNLESKGRH